MTRTTDLRPADPTVGARWTMLPAVLPVIVVAVALPLAAWVVDGRSQGERAATQLLMPLGVLWLALLLAASWALRAGQRRWALLLGGLWLLLGLSGNSIVADAAMGRWEWPPAEQPAAGGRPLRAVIVLGGGAGVDPAGREELKSDGQRIFAAAQLWHAGQTQSIICTGVSSRRRTPNPASIGRALLRSVGVPDEALFEVGGPNTYGEMQSLRRMLDDPPRGFPSQGQIGLITSAYHMRRAVRLARQAQIPVVPLPCGYRGAPAGQPFSPIDLIPSAGAAERIAIVAKECLAALIGR